MEYLIEASPSNTKFIESVIPSMMGQLGLFKSKCATLIKVTKEIPDDMDGATIPIGFLKNTYLVLIRPGNKMSIGTTLAHELVHVRQFARGTLRLDPKRGNVWRGAHYKDFPYLEQPWEIDALARQEIVFRRAIL